MYKISRIPVVIQVQDKPFSRACEGLQWPAGSSCYFKVCLFLAPHTLLSFWLIIILLKRTISHKIHVFMCECHCMFALFSCSSTADFCHLRCWARETFGLPYYSCYVLTAGSFILELRPSLHLHPLLAP